MDTKLNILRIARFLGWVGVTYSAHVYASTYTINLDPGFVQTFSELGYEIDVREGCENTSNGIFSQNSESRSVTGDSYVLTTPRCPNNTIVKYVDIRFSKPDSVMHSCTFSINATANSVEKTYTIDMFNCNKQAFYDNFLSNENNSTMALNVISDLPNSLVESLAPTTYICDTDKTAANLDLKPFNVENFLHYVDFHDSSNNQVIHSPTPQDLGNRDGFLSSIDNQSYLGEADLKDAPYYVHIKAYPLKNDTSLQSGFIDIQYWTFYGLNGSQFFRTGSSLLDGKNFIWNNFAKHEGDWEHVTVRVSHLDGANQYKILGVFFAGHGSGHWVVDNDLSYDAHHPKVYSACNSHAANERKEIFNEVDVEAVGTYPDAPVVGDYPYSVNLGNACAVWLKTIDEGSHSTIRWAPWEEHKIYFLDDDASCTEPAPAWVNYLGTYGVPPTGDPQSIIGLDDPFYDVVGACFETVAKTAYAKNPKVFIDFKPTAPRGPKQQNKAWTKIE